MKFTTHLELQSQTTRLVECTSYTLMLRIKDGVLTLPDTLFQRIYTQVMRWQCISRLQPGIAARRAA